MANEAPTLDPAFVQAFRAGTPTRTQAEAVIPRDHSAVVFMLLQLSAAVAGGTGAPAGGAHAPPGSVPPYAKQPAPPRGKKRGATNGHAGTSRPRPGQIDHRQTHQLP